MERGRRGWSHPAIERVVTGSESVDEDLIDLHADDADFFDSDVKDTPLSKIFQQSPKKAAAVPKAGAPAKTPPTSQLKKSSVKNRVTPTKPSHERMCSLLLMVYLSLHTYTPPYTHTHVHT